MDRPILKEIPKEEQDLIRKAKNDPEAFGTLYDRYYSQIFRFVMRRTGNYELAQDLTAETFFQALKAIWRFRLRKRPFSAWLYKIAIAQIANFYRKKSNYCEIAMDECPELINRPSSEINPAKALAEKIDTHEQYQKIHKLFLQLKKIQHDIVVLRYFEDMSFEEISKVTDLKLNTVKSHHRRALLKLRELVNANNINYDTKGIPQLERVLEESKARRD